MKKMPKQSLLGNFAVTYKTQNFKTKSWSVESATYETKSDAEAALMIAKTHKTKFNPTLIAATEEPADSASRAQDGGYWDKWTGCYKYSARW